MTDLLDMENTMNRATSEGTKERLLDDFGVVVTEAEQLLKAVAGESGDKASALLAKVEQNLKLARERLGDLQEFTVEKSKAAARATDDYVHEHPWRSIGIAAGVGIVIGLLLNRR